MTIVGAGALSNYVPKWIQEFGLDNQVDYRGFLPWQEVKNAYLDSDIFFFTSLRDSCPAQLLEAMAHGLPVLTLDLHGVKKLVPDRAGIKVTVTNPQQTVNSLAQAIEYLYNNFEERLNMSKIGYDFAKTQSWSHKALKMSECYEKLFC